MSLSRLPPGTTMGHVHLSVAEIAETIAFYRDVLGFGLMAQLGSHAAFLSAGGYHHQSERTRGRVRVLGGAARNGEAAPRDDRVARRHSARSRPRSPDPQRSRAAEHSGGADG